MKNSLRLILSLLLDFSLGGDCNDSDSGEGESTINLSGETAVMLPPGHLEGSIDGSTLYLPAETTPPLIHYANCFAGVPDPGDFGIYPRMREASFWSMPTPAWPIKAGWRLSM